MPSLRFTREQNHIKQTKHRSIPPSVGVRLESRAESSILDISVSLKKSMSQILICILTSPLIWPNPSAMFAHRTLTHKTKV